MTSYVAIDEATQSQILKYVDSVTPKPCDDIWLAGDRVKGIATPSAVWNVVAFTGQVPSDEPDPFAIQHNKQVAPGVTVALSLVHPLHWGDSSSFMADLRRFGYRLR